MANGDPRPAGTQPLPGWLGSAVAVTTQVGVPTVFAAVLLWFVLTRVNGTLVNIEEGEVRRTQLLEQTQRTFIDSIERQTLRFEQAIDKNITVNRELAERYHRPPPPQHHQD